MNARFILLLATSASLVCLVHANEADRLFYEAVRMEDNRQIEDAIASYEKASSHGHSASLHGNLANLYYRTKNYGKAILHYRKALLLDPNNKDIQANFAQVRTIAGLPNLGTSANDTYFAPSTTAIWCWTTIIFFWLGLFGSPFLIGAALPHYAKIMAIASWVGVISGGAYGAWRADLNVALLAREAVAVGSVHDSVNEETQDVIRLRRFAGDSNEANAELRPGEIVSIDLSVESILKQHVTPDGTVWFLARSRSGGKKGWATNKELIKVLD